MVIVAWNEASALARTLPALAAELGPQDEVIIVDNGSSDDLASAVAASVPSVRIIHLNRNAGYTAAVNRGVAAAGGDLLVILNPDAKPEAGFGEAVRSPLTDGSGWAAWMPLVVCQSGGDRVINSFGNPLHFTGFSWAGGHGLPVDQAGSSRPVPTLSGTCLVIPRAKWNRVGGFSDAFFLYQEDTDLSVRLRLEGESFGLLTEAVVDHDYDFDRRRQKFLWLERNRMAMIIRNYPTAVILVVLPALLVTELVVVAAAACGGWLPGKVKANVDLRRWMPRLLRERRKIQASSRISSGRFAEAMTAELDSAYFPDFVRSAPVRLLLRSYWQVARRLLR